MSKRNKLMYSEEEKIQLNIDSSTKNDDPAEQQVMDSKKKLIVSLILLLSLISVFIALGYAWFINNDNSGLDSIGFDSAKAIDSLISIDGTDFDEDASFDDGTIVLNEVSGLGFVKYTEEGAALALYNPKKDALTGKPLTVSKTDSRWDLEDSPIEENKHYVERDIYFKTNIPGKVYVQEANLLPLDLTDTSRISDFGDFSTDYIVGAVRVSFSEVIIENGKEVEYPRLVVAPNKTYEFSFSDGIYSVKEDGTPEEKYSFYDGTKQLDVLTDEETGETYVLFEDQKIPFWTDIKKAGEDGAVPVITLTKDGEDYVGTTRIRVWVEGTDRESVTQLSGGKFSRSFVFKAVGD